MSAGFKYWKLAIFKGLNGYFMAIAMAFLAFTDSEDWKTPNMKILRLVLFCLVAGHKFLDGFFDQTFSLLKSLKEQFGSLDEVPMMPEDPNKPKDKNTEAMKIIQRLFAFSILALACLHFSGCRLPSVEPGNDPIVVRAESFNETAKSSLRFILKTDDLDRQFFAENLPGFHNFCTSLRRPTEYQETNSLPWYRVELLTFDDTIVAYKEVKSASSSNALVAAQLSLSNLVSLANSWALVATNLSR